MHKFGAKQDDRQADCQQKSSNVKIRAEKVALQGKGLCFLKTQSFQAEVFTDYSCDFYGCKLLYTQTILGF